MTAVAHDGVVQWHYVASISDITAPTTTEVATSTRLPNITNYTTPASESEVDTSDIDSLYDTAVVGTTKAGPIELTFKRDDTDETDTWDGLTLRDTGFLVKLTFGGSGTDGAPAASDLAEVYPVQVGQRRPEGYGRNSTQKFMVSFYVTSDPELDAVLAAP